MSKRRLRQFVRGSGSTASRYGLVKNADEAWDVPGEEKGLEPDPTRNPEISQEMIAGRLDMTDVNARWLAEFKKEHGIK